MIYALAIPAVLIGFLLGLLGAGGSILTLPALSYIAGVPFKDATMYSLLIVGVLSFFGAVQAAFRREIDYSQALVFALPSLLAVYFSRKMLLPLMPDWSVELLFLSLLVLAGLQMLRKKNSELKLGRSKFWIPVDGALVGLVTGLVGAGGGFLIVPALVLFCGMNARMAMGSSLFIITLKSGVGFFADVQNGVSLDWRILSVFLVFGFVGILLGSSLKSRFSGDVLQGIFAMFLLSLACILAFVQLLNFL